MKFSECSAEFPFTQIAHYHSVTSFKDKVCCKTDTEMYMPCKNKSLVNNFLFLMNQVNESTHAQFVINTSARKSRVANQFIIKES